MKKLLLLLLLAVLLVGCENENPEAPNDVVWDSDFGIPPTHTYTFDANSDPLTIGKVMVRWMQQDNPDNLSWKQIQFHIPIEDKAEYDAIFLADLNSEPNEPKLTYTAKELDEIYKDEPALGKLAKSLWGVDE